MRDLQLEEIDQVNGGIGVTVAAVGFGLALGSKFVAVGAHHGPLHQPG